MKTEKEEYHIELVLRIYIDILTEFKKDYETYYMMKRMFGDNRKNTVKKAAMYREAACMINASHVQLGNHTQLFIPNE